jgi:hypothetical protein
MAAASCAIIATNKVRKASSGVASTTLIFVPAGAVFTRGRDPAGGGDAGVAFGSCAGQKGVMTEPTSKTTIVLKAYRMLLRPFIERISASSAFATRLANRSALRADQLAALLDERPLPADRARRPHRRRPLVRSLFSAFDARIVASIHQHTLTF